MSYLTRKDMKRICKDMKTLAYIKMKAVLQASNYRWQITNAPLLQGQRKLKGAAEECDNTLLRCKQQTLKEEQMKLQVSQSLVPKWMAHAAKSCVSSFLRTRDLRGMLMVQMNCKFNHYQVYISPNSAILESC